MLAWRARAAAVVNCIDETQADAPAVDFDVRLASVEEAARDGDDLPGEVAVRNLVLFSVDAEGAVFAHAPLGADEEGIAERGRVDEGFLIVLGVHGGGRAAEDAGVWTDLVEAGEPVAELLLHFVKGAYLTDVIERLLAKRAPEALHFAAGFGVVRFRVE